MRERMSKPDWKLVRKFINLALMPPHLIDDTFKDLRFKYLSRANAPFMSYFKRQWIKKVCFIIF